MRRYFHQFHEDPSEVLPVESGDAGLEDETPPVSDGGVPTGVDEDALSGVGEVAFPLVDVGEPPGDGVGDALSVDVGVGVDVGRGADLGPGFGGDPGPGAGASVTSICFVILAAFEIARP